MIQRSYSLTEINRAALNDSLSTALGAAYSGFADRELPQGFSLIVYLSGEISPAQIDTLNNLIAAHDPRQLTAEQQARQAQQQKLAAARRDYQGSDLDPGDYAAEDGPIQALARKVAWLEQEIADLRSSE